MIYYINIIKKEKMKKLILIILLFSNSILIFAQKNHKTLYENGQLKETGQFDKDEKPTGEWKKYYENGQVWNVINYENGIFKGEWKFYDENGKLKNIIHSENGLVENFNENGKLFCVGKQDIGTGKKNGEWKYYSSKGFIVMIENYKDDELNGDYKSYEDYEKLYAVGQYKNGKQIGEWKYFFENGDLKEIGNRENNNRNGVWKEYYKSEKLMWFRQYSNGTKIGVWKFYDERGNLIKSEEY